MVQHHVQAFRRGKEAALRGGALAQTLGACGITALFLSVSSHGLSRIATGTNALPTSCRTAARVVDGRLVRSSRIPSCCCANARRNR